MNELRRIGVVLPCEGLSDFPTFYEGQDAAELLAAWATAWRPRLIAAAGSPPEILCSFELPSFHDDQTDPQQDFPFEGLLALAPDLALEEEVHRWIDEGRELLGDRWLAIEKFASRSEIISAIKNSPFEQLAADCGEFDDELAALGFARLQTAVVTGGGSDDPAFDDPQFDAAVVAAAKAAVALDKPAFEAALRTAYDLLETLRNHCYPLDAWLLDTVLVGPTTLGDRLHRELAEPTPKSVRLAGQTAKTIAHTPTSCQALREAVLQQRVSVTAADGNGEPSPPSWSCLSPEEMADRLEEVTGWIQQITQVRPQIFSPWSCRLPPRLVQALAQQNYAALLLGGFSDQYPRYCEHTKAFVSAAGGVELSAITRKPLDLTKPETFLHWGNHLGETLQNEPVATLHLAGWADCRHESLDLLRRIARRSPVLGRFVTTEEYFCTTASAERDTTPEMEQLGVELSGLSQAPPPVAQQHLAEGLATIAGAEGELPAQERCATLVGGSANEGPETARTLLVNPWSFANVVSRSPSGGSVQVPGCGFTVLDSTPASAQRLEPLKLVNPFAAVELDAISGGIRSLLVPEVRGPLLSQRLVTGSRPDQQGLVAMRAERIDPPVATATSASITATGQLLDRSERAIAKFSQRVSLDTASRLIRIRIELEPTSSRAADRWFASRLMLRGDDWRTLKSVQWHRLPTEAADIAASDYVELRTPNQRVSLSCDQGVRIRKQTERAFDAMLVERLEAPATLEYLLGFGDHRPLHASLAKGCPPWEFSYPPNKPSTEGWWLHLDSQNVVVSRIVPAPPRGAQVHLIETEGRSVRCRLRLWRAVKSAEVMGPPTAETMIGDSGEVQIEIPAHGWLRINLSW